MKLLINTASTHKGGGVQVASSFIEECKKYDMNQYHIILGVGLSKIIDMNSYPNNFVFYPISYRPATKVFTFTDPAVFLKKIESKVKPDVVFTTSGPAYWKPKAPHLMGFNLPHYLYTDSPFFKKQSAAKRLKWFFKGLFIKYFTKRDADAYIAQTDDVNTRLRKWINTDEVFTISNTFGQQYQKTVFDSDGLLLPSKKQNEFRFLIFTSYYKHKNIEILNDIITILKQKRFLNIKFVLTLPQMEFDKCVTESSKKFTYNLGPIPPSSGPELYNECDAVFSPTLLECFSATYAEAMQMQKTILTTDLSFAHTVCGDAALYFSPLDAVDASSKIISLASDKKLREKLIKNGNKEKNKFMTAEQRASSYLELCNVLIKKRK